MLRPQAYWCSLWREAPIGALAKLRKVSISFIMPFVNPHETIQLLQDEIL
jgi:hypothetical protein